MLLEGVWMPYNSRCLRPTSLRLSRPPRPCLLSFLSASEDDFILGVSEVNISITRKSTGMANHTVLQGCVRPDTAFEVSH